MADVFISYARSTATQAQAAASALRSLGYSVWIDDELPAHRAYSRVIEEQLGLAKAALVIWSEDATKSEWVMSEASRAREASKLVQAKIDKTRLPMPFDQIQCADLLGWSGESDANGWRKAVASIADLVGQAAPEGAVHQAQPSARPSQAERRHITFLSCDLVNATEVAGQLDPEEWQDVATRHRREVAQAVSRLGAHVAKADDGLAAYFGYPEAQEDAAERAVRAGLAILERTARLNEEFAREDKPRLSVRVGIHAGTVVVTPTATGNPEMFGDAPGVAAHAEAAAAPDTVVMTDAVHELVSGLFVVEAANALDEKGVGPRLYRVVRPGLSGGRARGFTARELTPFVGREDEMELFLSRWRRVREDEGQVVLIMGEPGIGKSRVIEEFRARIKADPHLWIECSGAPLFANTPFHAVAEMFRHGLGWRSDESEEKRIARLEAGLKPTGMNLGEAVPLMAELLGLPAPTTYAPLSLAPDQRRSRLLAAMAGWVFSATRSQPLVIVVEDLQWVDPSTMELIQTLVEQGATAPLMLLCTARPEFRAPWNARAHHAQITLNRLNSRQTRQLVASVTSQTGLAAEVVEAVIKRTDGVPLFAEELTRLMMEGHHRRSGAHAIPETLLDSLTARLDRLGPAKEVAQLASVIGREFSYDLLRAVSPASEAELQSGLARLAEAELIYVRGSPPHARYQFKHALMQDAAYESLLRSKRRELHAHVARTITETFANLDQAQPEVTALHWTQAGEAEPAIAAWKRAGDAAYVRRAFNEAALAYRQALAMLATQAESPERDMRELELWSALNRVLQLTSGYAAADTVEAAGRARALAEKAGSLSQLIREEARVWRSVITAGDYAGAAALADHILDLARGGEENPGRLVFAHNAQVQTRFYTGDLPGVEEHFGRLSPLIDTAGQRQAPGNNIVAIGVASLNAWILGRAGTARDRMTRAFAFAENSQNPYDLAMALHFQGILSSLERDATRAEEVAAKLLALSDEHGFSYASDLARGTLGWAWAQRGELDEGLVLMRQAWTSLSGSGARVGITYGLTQLAATQGLAAPIDAAFVTIEDALTANPQERVFRPETLRARGDLQLKVPDAARAAADFRDAFALARSMGAKAWELRAATSLARLLQDQGDPGAARSLLAPIVAGLADDGDATDLEDARSLLNLLGG
jgi:class 3 adenylate cyclase